MVDQRFLPRILEGEYRLNMIGSRPVDVVHKMFPKKHGEDYTYKSYSADDSLFERLLADFKQDLPHLMSALGRAGEPLPPIWTADFIIKGRDPDSGEDVFALMEMNCECVGISQQLHLARFVAQSVVDACEEGRKTRVEGKAVGERAEEKAAPEESAEKEESTAPAAGEDTEGGGGGEAKPAGAGEGEDAAS